MNSERKTEILVGLFLLVGMLLLGAIILEFGNIRSYFRDTYTLKVAFPKAAGIKEASPVYLGGSRVGKVKHYPRLNATYTGVIMDLEIFDNVEIPSDSTFVIASDGLMGDAMIEIQPTGKETSDFLPHDHKEIIVGNSGSGLSDLQSQAEVVAKKVDQVLDDVRIALKDVKGAMEKVNKGALSDETVEDFKQSMQHLNKTMTRVNEKVLGEENAALLKSALQELKEAATSFKTAAKSIEDSSKKLGPMFDKLDPAITKADSVMTTANDSLQSIKKAADSFSEAARSIMTGKGLLGALIHDSRLKADFQDLIYNAKVNGVLWYKNTADKERSKQAPAPAHAPNPAPQQTPTPKRTGLAPLFGR